MFNEQRVIKNIEEWVKEELNKESSGHDWYHIKRVTNLAEKIAENENADIFIVTLASLLHDIVDDKISENTAHALQRVTNLLKENEVGTSEINIVLDIITTISFKGGNFKELSYIEAKIVQDADRLDALGAIGIARTFQYGGAHGRVMHDPSINVRKNMSLEEYRKGTSSSINHFYEKILLLKDKMNTSYAIKVAEEREEFVKLYLETFLKEWNSEI